MNKNLAHETLKSFIENTDNVIVKDAILALHPELTESEDERIRKAILGLTYIDGIEPILTKCSITAEDIRFYLEKQKDSDKAQLAVELIDMYIDEHTANAHEMSDSFPDKKYYSGVDDTLSNIAGILIKAYSEEGQKKQKDYRKLYEEVVKSDWFKENYVGKSLGDDEKQKEQQPAEWSEEDEKKLSAVLFSISRFGGEEHLKTKGYKYAEISNWLKSLRPQPKQHWI